ncbi:MAG: DMT family transporter [Halodesulfurarchaeum sp.]
MIGVTFAILFAMLMGIASIFSRRGLESGSFVAMLFISLAVAAPIFVVIAFLTGGMAGTPLTGVVYAAAGALFGSVVGRAFYLLGINYLGPGKSLSIYATAPLYAAILSWAVLEERLTPLVILGTVAIVLGIVVLSKDVREETNRAGHSMHVMLYPAAGAVLASGAVTMRKLALDAGIRPLMAATVNMVVGFLAVSPLLATRYRSHILDLDQHARRNFLAASLVMASGFLVYFFGLRVANASVFFPLIQTQPLFAVVLSAVFLSDLEVVTRWTVAASGLVVVGAVLVILG